MVFFIFCAGTGGKRGHCNVLSTTMAMSVTSPSSTFSPESLFKFFIKVFSLDIDVSEHEVSVFIEISVDGDVVERTVDHR